MSFTGFLSKIFGDKSSRDRKLLQPLVDRINAIGPDLKPLTNDELRARIDAVRADIDGATAEDRKAIEEARATIETLPVDQRQHLWDEIDRREKNILDTLEKKLDEHLCEVFAVMRETAARFAANADVIVTARSRPCRTRPRLRHHRWRQGHLAQPLDGRWQRNHLGHGAL